MMTDNYLDMKEILKLLIISSQIIYDHMEIIQYQHLFIYLFIYSFIYLSIYLSIYLFDTYQSSFSVFSKNLVTW